jgi:hypothetical protein
MMAKRLISIRTLAMTAVLVLWLPMAAAQEPAEQEGSAAGEVPQEAVEQEEAEEAPDFSRDTLLTIFRPDDVYDPEVVEDIFEYRTGDWIFRFLPLLMPLTVNDGSYGSANLHEPVVAFSLLGVDYPMAGPAGDEDPPDRISAAERRFRWKMIRQVNAANARDNRE